jgi:biopolymer transport protein ExbD
MSLYALPKDDEGFELTPMIDVVFLLIVFFMTVASMITADKVEMTLAVADESQIATEISDRFTFSINQQGIFFAGPEPATEERIAELLHSIRAANPRARILLRADRLAEHQHVNTFLGLCAAAGLSDIIFATYQSDL